jgi:hypothetical protein
MSDEGVEELPPPPADDGAAGAESGAAPSPAEPPDQPADGGALAAASSPAAAEAAQDFAEELALAEQVVAKEQESLQAAQADVEAANEDESELQRQDQARAEAAAAQAEVAAALAAPSTPLVETFDAGTFEGHIEIEDADGGAAATPKPKGDKRSGKKPSRLTASVSLPRIVNKASPKLTGSASTQALHSVRRSAPSFGFGSATREQAGKLFVSQEHTSKALSRQISPGPARYTMLPSIGGPKLGKQPDGRKPDPPVWKFATADRFLYGYGKSEQRPDPGAYTPAALTGNKQSDSARQDAPQWKIGTSTRAQARKVFISNKHQKSDLVGNSPGPAAYLLPATVGGKQPDGRMADQPTWTMPGRTRAQPEGIPESPGPIYPLPRGIGKQPDHLRSEPAYSMASPNRMPAEEGGKLSPGPIYESGSSLGAKQASSRNRRGARPTFGNEDRWAKHEAELRRNTIPAPGHYG